MSSPGRFAVALFAGAMLCVAGRGMAAPAPQQSEAQALLTAARVARIPAAASGEAESAAKTPSAAMTEQAIQKALANTRYLMGDGMGALDAWNRAGEPRIDTISIRGAKRSQPMAVLRAIGLEPHAVLTSEAFALALRRLRDLPIASKLQMSYEPLEGGLVRLDVDVDERHVVPSGWIGLGTVAVRAAVLNELHVDFAGPLGAGELTSASWRWSVGRPRVTLGVEIPSPQWLSGVVTLDALWERQTYDATQSSSRATQLSEERRRVRLRLADWSTSWLRWQTGAAVDRLREYSDLSGSGLRPRAYVALESTLDVRLSRDRFALTASAGWWAPFGGGDRFGTGGLSAAWRSTDDPTIRSWTVVAQVAIASQVSPLALWQGAGTSSGRSWLLRAHPLLTHGVLTGEAFGREVANATAEYTLPVRRTRVGVLSIAGFVDSARAWHRPSGLGSTPLYIDAGVGVRLHAPGSSGAIRFDIARGLRGGGTTLSASWGKDW